MTTPSGKVIPPRQRKIALLGSRSVGEWCSVLHENRRIRIELGFKDEFMDPRRQSALKVAFMVDDGTV